MTAEIQWIFHKLCTENEGRPDTRAFSKQKRWLYSCQCSLYILPPLLLSYILAHSDLAEAALPDAKQTSKHRTRWK